MKNAVYQRIFKQKYSPGEYVTRKTHLILTRRMNNTPVARISKQPIPFRNFPPASFLSTRDRHCVHVRVISWLLRSPTSKKRIFISHAMSIIISRMYYTIQMCNKLQKFCDLLHFFI